MKQFCLLTFFFYHLSALADTCPPGEYWVSPHPRSAYTKAGGVFYSAADVTGFCRSKGKNYDFWSEKISNGKIEGWPHEREKFKNWTSQENSRTIEALGKISDKLWMPIRLFRATQSHTMGNPASSAEEVIVLYDSAFKKHDIPLDRYLLHELAHEHFRKMKKFETVVYQQAAQWKEVTVGGVSELKSSRERAVLPDSHEGPAEDFANNLEYFVYEPFKLKFKNPQLYDWFTIEYGDKIKK